MLSSSCQSQWSVCGTAVKRQRKAEGVYRQVNAARKWGPWPHGARAFLVTFRKLARKSETLHSALKIPGCIVRGANGLVLGLGITRVGTRTSWFRRPDRVRPHDSKRLVGARHPQDQADPLRPQAAGFQNCAGCGIRRRPPSVPTIHRYAASTKRGVEDFLAASLTRNRLPPKQTKPDRNAEGTLVGKFEAWEWPMPETGPASRIVRRQMPRRLWANGQGLGK